MNGEADAVLSRSDYVMRLVKQLAEVIARLLKLRAEGDEEKVNQVLGDACVALFGVEHRVLHMLDANSAASLLGDKAKVDAYAKLLDAAGDTARAEALRRASR